MNPSKYPKAQAFLDAHPEMSLDQAIAFLERETEKT